MADTLPIIATLPTSSVEYLKVPIEHFVSGVASNPTSFPVSFAFTVVAPNGSTPTPSSWSTGSWETANATYFARGLVGGLTVGEWAVWCRITASPEVPVRKVGKLVIE